MPFSVACFKTPKTLLGSIFLLFRVHANAFILKWPGILNATASPLYTKTYGFNSTDVGFAYFGAVVGMVIG